nr:asparagine--trna ligase, cytoplasmic 2 [Quercus suber]
MKVTTLLGKADIKVKPNTRNDTDGVSPEVIKSAVKEKSKVIEELKRGESNKEALTVAVQDFHKTNELESQLEAKEISKPGTSLKADINFSEDFFARQTYLTVSDRLHLESHACALGNVYSVGPRFRADSTKHVDAMSCADDFFKFLCKWILDNCSEDLKFVSKRIDKTCIAHLQSMISTTIEKISYADAVDSFKQVADNKFEKKLEWGDALTAGHLSYLAEEIYKKLVIIYNYPKEVKPFYAGLNDDRKTVAAFDMVVPKVSPE